MSSLVYLGFSVIVFLLSYGIMFLVASAVLGAFFSAIGGVAITDPGWSAMNTNLQKEIQFIVPLIPTVGLFIFIIKVLMASSIRGRD